MKLKTTTLLLTFVLIMSTPLMNCQSAVAANPSFLSSTIVLSPAQGAALFTLYFSNVNLFGRQKGHASAKTTYWMPTKVEVAQAEAKLWLYTQITLDNPVSDTNPLNYRPNRIALTGDLRQFVGVTQDGRRLLLINGCSNFRDYTLDGELARRLTNDSTRTHLPYFPDNGSSFRAAYDPASRQIVYLTYDDFVEQDNLMRYANSTEV